VPVKAQEAMITDLVVTNTKTDLLTFFNVENAFTPELEEGLHHGIAITFTFEVVMEMNRNGWLDKEIYNDSFQHTLTYDSLKMEYTVERQEHQETRIFNDLATARDFMCEVNSFAVAPLAALVADQQYLLQVKATLAKNTLPLNFHYVVPFSEFWDLKTEWTSVEFHF